MKYLFALFFPCLLFSSATDGLFNQFPNRYFVETGSYQGHGIELALQANFHEIHSIELALHHYEGCRNKFASKPNIHLWLGDSATLLESVIAPIQEPITFWLDGHWSHDTTARGSTNTPLLQELDTIARHPIKTHTILIDDVRLFGTDDFDYIGLPTIIEKIREINPNYRFLYKDGYRENDILVAYISE